MGLNLIKKTYEHHFREHTTIILKEMCSRVNADFNKLAMEDMHSNWYERHIWNKDEENSFRDWMTNYLYNNAKARREIMTIPIKSKQQCHKVADIFVSWYGWKTKRRTLKYYAYDWDDNILHMPTPIHMFYKGKPKDILPLKFAKIRTNPNWTLAENAVEEFRDTGPRGTKGFMSDIKTALSNKKYAPSWKQFIESLIEGSIIIIITARGHSPKILRNAVKYIIETYLSAEEKEMMIDNVYKSSLYYGEKLRLKKENVIDWYLDQCMFMGVYSEHFKETFNIELKPTQAEIGKEHILNHFISTIQKKCELLGCDFTVGISDDDIKNLNHIRLTFKKYNYPNLIGFYIYDTSDPENIVKSELMI